MAARFLRATISAATAASTATATAPATATRRPALTTRPGAPDLLPCAMSSPCTPRPVQL